MSIIEYIGHSCLRCTPITATVSGWLSGLSVSPSHTVSREFASQSGQTKDHHKNGTNCLPDWHEMR